jgi:hypothetical protein
MFVNRNYFPHIKHHKTQWNSREGTANSSRDVFRAKVTQHLTIFRRYSQLVANRCCRLACSLLETPFVTRDVFCSENLFVNRLVRDERRSWTEGPLYLEYHSCSYMFRRWRSHVWNTRFLRLTTHRQWSTPYLHLFGTYDVAYAQFHQDTLGSLKMALLQRRNM